MPESLVYKAGLDRIQESVISSHFMHKLASNSRLQLYDEDQFASTSLEIDAKAVCDRLIPSLMNACNAFSGDRAICAKQRARENYRRFGLDTPEDVGLAQFITEAMFDRQYLRAPKDNCSREILCNKVKEQIEAGSPIEMVIPALPYKFSSPLKNRGRLPDLADVNFMLGLYEIALTIELIYKEARPGFKGQLARFAIVSDGSRFKKVVGESDRVIEEYRAHLRLWIDRLGLERYITLFDYQTLLSDRLPAAACESKSAIMNRALREYADAMWPIYDPDNISATFAAAARVEPDPEAYNPEGRFVSLLKSLVYTINYRTLRKFECLPAGQYRALYRDLIGHIFEPYASPLSSELDRHDEEVDLRFPPSSGVKECLRRAMLKEAWNAAIEYVAEIKSARELEEDPILTCLPSCFRWTIHAKSGQLAVLTPTAFGTSVQAWAGAAVFMLTKKTKIKLCTLPVLALEGVGAIPVRSSAIDDVLALADQPLFYIHPNITFTDLDEFLDEVDASLIRKRKS